MARGSVNAIVALGSAVTLTASVAGVAVADGYWSDSATDDQPDVGVVSAQAAVDVAPSSATGLAPLPPMQLSPLDGPAVPRIPTVQVQRVAPAGMVQAPAPAPAPSQPTRRTRAS